MPRSPETPETCHVLKSSDEIVELPIRDVLPSPENDTVYKPIDPNDPDIKALAADIGRLGVLEPLTVTLDYFVLSGHRRRAAAKLARLKTVPCRIYPIRRTDDIDEFVRLLASHNKQRIKSFDEKVREEAIQLKPGEAYAGLLSERAERARLAVETITMEAPKRRSVISKAKKPMLDAVLKVLDEREDYWPLSDRQIHYALLNDPPLVHAKKPNSQYRNNRNCYSGLCDLLTRARLEGIIGWRAIADETRPVTNWDVYRDPQPFLRKQMGEFCKGYCRDLQQSQPNHIEVLVEKNTVASLCRSVCGKYCVPMTSGRGYCSLPPRREIKQRFAQSGRNSLVLLIISDFDPEGENIAESFARSMRDDFDIKNVHAVKVALTSEQVEEHRLTSLMVAKKGSSRRAKFVQEHGECVWELEALEPQVLQELLDEAIRSVMDIDAYNREVEAERADATQIQATRIAATDFLKGLAA